MARHTNKDRKARAPGDSGTGGPPRGRRASDGPVPCGPSILPVQSERKARRAAAGGHVRATSPAVRPAEGYSNSAGPAVFARAVHRLCFLSSCVRHALRRDPYALSGPPRKMAGARAAVVGSAGVSSVSPRTPDAAQAVCPVTRAAARATPSALYERDPWDSDYFSAGDPF